MKQDPTVLSLLSCLGPHMTAEQNQALSDLGKELVAFREEARQRVEENAKELSLEVVTAHGVACVYLGNYRIAGRKPEGAGKTEYQLKCLVKDVKEAIDFAISMG